jgi:hypothetical protein
MVRQRAAFDRIFGEQLFQERHLSGQPLFPVYEAAVLDACGVPEVEAGDDSPSASELPRLSR